MRPMEGGWMPHMARLLLPNTEKLHIPSARCIIHALLECMCGLETRTDDGKSCTQVNHKWEIFFFFIWLLWLGCTHSISSLQSKVLVVTCCSVRTVIWYGTKSWTCNTGFQLFCEHSFMASELCFASCVVHKWRSGDSLTLWGALAELWRT